MLLRRAEQLGSHRNGDANVCCSANLSAASLCRHKTAHGMLLSNIHGNEVVPVSSLLHGGLA